MTANSINPGALAGATGAKEKAGQLPGNVSTPQRPRKATRQARWVERNPLKRWAHIAYQAGVRRGLVKPTPCEACGEPKSEAHHPDYLRPLDVVFLCHPCHQRRHAAERRAGDGKG